ncbi:MAG: DEAD/DEAH box helicase [Thermoleophilia bacterium]|nr:DEAD/DEAH box helicase [Thermoleophilia bacterium]
MTAMTSAAPARGFDQLGLPQALVHAVEALGFAEPTQIQAAAIPALLSGRDVTGVARTGTGKTAAFGLPLVNAVDPAVRTPQALVLAPTRELAVQVAEALQTFAHPLHQVDVVAVYGGAPFWAQRKALADGAQIVVGTPGRIMDHLGRGTLVLDDVRFVVLDEADEMLRMGFAEDVDTILSSAPAARQTALFSATMPAAIRRVAQQHLTDPVDVTVEGSATAAGSIAQAYAVVPFRERADALARTLEASDADATIVFVRTKSACDDVAAALVPRGIRAAVLNGDVPQADRERIVRRLREGAVDVLVATDVAARGLDVDRIDLVVNFDAPQDAETYVHRIGRTGRADRTGRALTFLAPRERHMVRGLERQTGGRLEEIAPPAQGDVYALRARRALDGLGERLARPRADAYRDALARHAEESGIDVADLAAALLAHAAGDDGTWTAPPPPPPAPDRPARRDRDRPRGGDERPSRRDRTRGTAYRLGVGHRNGARPANIVGAITGAGRLDGKAVGRIDIHDRHSIVEIIGDLPEADRRRIGVARIGGRPLGMEPDRAPRHRPGPRAHDGR